MSHPVHKRLPLWSLGIPSLRLHLCPTPHPALEGPDAEVPGVHELFLNWAPGQDRADFFTFVPWCRGSGSGVTSQCEALEMGSGERDAGSSGSRGPAPAVRHSRSEPLLPVPWARKLRLRSPRARIINPPNLMSTVSLTGLGVCPSTWGAGVGPSQPSKDLQRLRLGGVSLPAGTCIRAGPRQG